MTAEERAEYVMARFEPSDPPDRLRVLITAAVLIAETEMIDRLADALGMAPRYLMAMIGRVNPETAEERA